MEYYNKNIEIIYIDNLKYCCYLIFVDVNVDYKEQVFISKIKANVQYFVYYILSQKQNNMIIK